MIEIEFDRDHHCTRWSFAPPGGAAFTISEYAPTVVDAFDRIAQMVALFDGLQWQYDADGKPESKDFKDFCRQVGLVVDNPRLEFARHQMVWRWFFTEFGRDADRILYAPEENLEEYLTFVPREG